MRGRRIAAAGRVDERDLLRSAAPGGGEEAVAFAIAQAGGVDIVTLGRAHPALGRKHDRGRLAGDEGGLVERLRGRAGDQGRTPVVADISLRPRAARP